MPHAPGRMLPVLWCWHCLVNAIFLLLLPPACCQVRPNALL
jgi:hypothetical protein